MNEMTFIEILRKEFEIELAQKTGWGRNELLAAFDKASVRALYKYAKQQGVNLD